VKDDKLRASPFSSTTVYNNSKIKLLTCYFYKYRWRLLYEIPFICELDFSQECLSFFSSYYFHLLDITNCSQYIKSKGKNQDVSIKLIPQEEKDMGFNTLFSVESEEKKLNLKLIN